MKCDKGFNGMCCCNCIHQKQLHKHPQNKIYKGQIDEKLELYTCLGHDELVIFENKHGMCEEYETE